MRQHLSWKHASWLIATHFCMTTGKRRSRRPWLLSEMLIHNDVPGFRRKDLQGFEKLDQRILVVLTGMLKFPP